MKHVLSQTANIKLDCWNMNPSTIQRDQRQSSTHRYRILFQLKMFQDEWLMWVDQLSPSRTFSPVMCWALININHSLAYRMCVFLVSTTANVLIFRHNFFHQNTDLSLQYSFESKFTPNYSKEKRRWMKIMPKREWNMRYEIWRLKAMFKCPVFNLLSNSKKVQKLHKNYHENTTFCEIWGIDASRQSRFTQVQMTEFCFS